LPLLAKFLIKLKVKEHHTPLLTEQICTFQSSANSSLGSKINYPSKWKFLLTLENRDMMTLSWDWLGFFNYWHTLSSFLQ
jgi:hypothetical protein